MTRCEPKPAAEWRPRGLVALLACSMLLLSVSAGASDSGPSDAPEEQKITHYLASSPAGAVIRPDPGKARLCQRLSTARYSEFTCNVTTVVRVESLGHSAVPDLSIESFLQVEAFSDSIERSDVRESKCKFNHPSDERCETVGLTRISDTVRVNQEYSVCTVIEADGPLFASLPVSVQMAITCDEHLPGRQGLIWEDEP